MDNPLPLEGLPRRQPPEDDDAGWWGVHPPLPDPCAAGRVSPHPLLWLESLVGTAKGSRPPPGMPRRPTSKRQFNAHNPGGRGSGLVQPVFRSPARIPAAESTRRGLCAAPPSEKRYTLSRFCYQDKVGESACDRFGCVPISVVVRVAWRPACQACWRMAPLLILRPPIAGAVHSCRW
jgi:hypothetical protein